MVGAQNSTEHATILEVYNLLGIKVATAQTDQEVVFDFNLSSARLGYRHQLLLQRQIRCKRGEAGYMEMGLNKLQLKPILSNGRLSMDGCCELPRLCSNNESEYLQLL
ncbi:hypothetical protein N186_05935 [Thermofilum adornatum]|uniref:Uncharacterized protein n=1 Tax=Thermofilum adornatum TaxID=1365176 RepID=S6A5R3_9CREN|nr:hypothetical protein N186_05935 [Thermofilum adornatum]